jgi:hypothetical protein
MDLPGGSFASAICRSAAAAAVGHFKFGQRRQEAGRRTALFVRLRRKLCPHQFDAGQTQLAEQQLNARDVDRVERAHAATCKVGVTATAMTAANSS